MRIFSCELLELDEHQNQAACWRRKKKNISILCGASWTRHSLGLISAPHPFNRCSSSLVKRKKSEASLQVKANEKRGATNELESEQEAPRGKE